ncbi:MAG: gamma-glutamyl-gamma-aminobutyrate hydrolase family protein [Butyricicoccus sp.]
MKNLLLSLSCWWMKKYKAFGCCPDIWKTLRNRDLPMQHPSPTEHHQKPPHAIPVHCVRVFPDTTLYDTLRTETLAVNSYHHQVIRTPASHLQTMP